MARRVMTDVMAAQMVLTCAMMVRVRIVVMASRCEVGLLATMLCIMRVRVVMRRVSVRTMLLLKRVVVLMMWRRMLISVMVRVFVRMASMMVLMSVMMVPLMMLTMMRMAALMMMVALRSTLRSVDDDGRDSCGATLVVYKPGCGVLR